MVFEWDKAKSERLKAERGASFEDLRKAILHGGLIGYETSPRRPEQFLLIVRLEDEVWAIAAEQRGEKTRLVTAYPSRKWRKKYEA